MARKKRRSWKQQWQHDYDKAVGAGGKVLDVFSKTGISNGVALIVSVREGREVVYYSPYYNASATETWVIEPEDAPDGEGYSEYQHAEDSPDEFVDSMTGATDWGDWDWGEPYDSIPGVV